jgi:hypothetical protein
MRTAIIVFFTLVVLISIAGILGAFSISELKEECINKNGIMVRTETDGYKCFDRKVIKK